MCINLWDCVTSSPYTKHNTTVGWRFLEFKVINCVRNEVRWHWHGNIKFIQYPIRFVCTKFYKWTDSMHNGTHVLLCVCMLCMLCMINSILLRIRDNVSKIRQSYEDAKQLNNTKAFFLQIKCYHSFGCLAASHLCLCKTYWDRNLFKYSLFILYWMKMSLYDINKGVRTRVRWQFSAYYL